MLGNVVSEALWPDEGAVAEVEETVRSPTDAAQGTPLAWLVGCCCTENSSEASTFALVPRMIDEGRWIGKVWLIVILPVPDGLEARERIKRGSHSTQPTANDASQL